MLRNVYVSEVAGRNSNSSLPLLRQVLCYRPRGCSVAEPFRASLILNPRFFMGALLSPNTVSVITADNGTWWQWTSQSCSICQHELSSDPVLCNVGLRVSHIERSLKPLQQKALEGLGLLKATSGLSNMHTNNIITAEWFGERVYFVVVPITF